MGLGKINISKPTFFAIILSVGLLVGVSFSSVYAGIPWDTAEIADDAITSEKIKDKTIKTKDIRNNQIKSSKIRDGEVKSADLAPGLSLTGDFTVDTNTLVVDSSNNRVGMGTTNPGRLLTVIDGTPNTAQLRLGQTDSRFWDLWGGFDLHFQKNGNTKMFLKDNGNVGIGTTSPNERLDVIGDAEVTGEYEYASAKTRYLTIAGGQCNGVNIGDSTAGPFRCNLLQSNSRGYWDVSLPHGVTITGFQARIFAQVGTVTCTLHEGTENSGTTMASVSRSTNSWAWTAEDTSIVGNPVDNINNAYAVQCRTSGGNIADTVGAIRVKYTTSIAQ